MSEPTRSLFGVCMSMYVIRLIYQTFVNLQDLGEVFQPGFQPIFNQEMSGMLMLSMDTDLDSSKEVYIVCLVYLVTA